MLSSKVLPTSVRGVNTVSSRSICHKSKLKPKRNNYFWPYERRSWGPWNFFLDPDTKGKFDENTKIIQVEGNISSGKNDFAKKLADQLNMAYFPQPNLSDYYKNKHGFDYVALNGLLPERLRYCTWDMFHENPARHSVIHLQHFLFRMRIFQYYKALAHIFNTGQGVVLTRTCFSERAIIEAMHNVGWLPKGYLRDDGVRFYDWKQRYIFLRNMALARTNKPHLSIYLDTPIDVCLERIKADPNPVFANSKVHTREFLEEIDTAFKDIVLPKQDHNGHVMIIDHPRDKTIDEVNDVIDDIEAMNFEHDIHDTKFVDWWDTITPNWYFEQRNFVTTRKFAGHINSNLDWEWYDIAGLGDSISHADCSLRQALCEGHVGPVGWDTAWETDEKVHGFLTSIFGKYPNHGERVNKKLYLDCL